MKKQIIAFITLFALSLSLGISATAAAYQSDDNSNNKAILARAESLDTSKEIEDALTGVIDSNVSKEVLDNIAITSSDNNDVSYTVKYLGNITNTDNTEGKLYTLTAASTKSTTGTATEDNVDCWITLTWIDNLGTSNEIVSVSGGWTSNGRTLSNRQVWFGVVGVHGEFLDDQYEDKYPGGDSYYYTPSDSLVGLSLRAYSLVNSAGYPMIILCDVRPTIFD